jgi:hypothetical protein
VISDWSRILEDTVLRHRGERQLIDAGNLHRRATPDPPGVAP